MCWERCSMGFLKIVKRSDNDELYEEQEGLSPISIGVAWGSRILAFSLEFALLVIFGRIVDERLGTEPFGLTVGVAIGVCSFVSGIMLTVKRMERIEKRAKKRKSSTDVDGE